MKYYKNKNIYYEINEKTQEIKVTHVNELDAKEKTNLLKLFEIKKYDDINNHSWYGKENSLKNIAFVELEKVSTSMIQFKIEEYKVTVEDNNSHNTKIECIKKRKNPRYLEINLETKMGTIKSARSKYGFDLTKGLATIHETIYPKLFSIKATLVVLSQDDKKMMDTIFTTLEEDKKFGYIREMNEQFIKLGNANSCYYTNPNNLYHLTPESRFIRKNSYTSTFTLTIATLCYYIGNPGLESIIKNDLFVLEVFKNFICKNKVLPSGKLNEILGISKSGLKATNYIIDCFLENISKTSLSQTKLDNKQIYPLISSVVTEYLNTFNVFVDNVNGLNNTKAFLDIWSSEYFFQVYYLKLKYNNERYRFSYDDDARMKAIYQETVKGTMQELTKAISEFNSLLSKRPSYKNNLQHAFVYLCSLMRKQGYTDLSEGIRLLTDYTRMCNQLEVSCEKYPKHIKTSHDIVMMNQKFYEATENELNGDGFQTAVKSYLNLEWNILKNKYVILAPSNYNELFIEGCSLNHCVSSYISKVINGTSKIIFLRKKESLETSYFTIEVQKDTITHVKGLNQCDPDDDVKDFIHAWAERNKLDENY